EGEGVFAMRTVQRDRRNVAVDGVGQLAHGVVTSSRSGAWRLSCAIYRYHIYGFWRREWPSKPGTTASTNYGSRCASSSPRGATRGGSSLAVIRGYAARMSSSARNSRRGG